MPSCRRGRKDRLYRVYTMFLALYDFLLQCAWEKVCSTRRCCHVLYKRCAAYNYLPEARGLCSVHTIVLWKPLSPWVVGIAAYNFLFEISERDGGRSAAYIFLIGGLKMCNIYLFLSQFYTWGWGYWMWISIRRHRNRYSQERNWVPPSQFSHSCVCEWFMYSQDWSAYSAAGKYVDRFWEYINRAHVEIGTEARNSFSGNK